VKSVELESKTIYPSKIICVGRNYVEHIRELGNEIPENIVLFIKPNSSISSELIHPKRGEPHFEGELCFMIFDNQIEAIGFGLDLTLRDVQNSLKAKSLPWEKAKAFTNSAPLSNFIYFDEKEIKNLEYRLYIDDKLRQSADIDLMIYKPETILSETLKYFELEDGDIIMSGTPKGVGTFEIGDRFKAQILHNNETILEQNWICR